jgi:hypothetical protein
MAELEGGKPAAQIAQEHSIHPGLPASGEMNWPRILKERIPSMATGASMRSGSPSLRGY